MHTQPPASPATPPQRVLVIGSNNFPDSMEWHVLDALARMGCTTLMFETRRIFNGVPGVLGKIVAKTLAVALREPERLIERELVRATRAFDPQLVLVILGSQVSPKTISLLRKATQAPIACWCQDAITNLGRQYVLGAGYDAVFLKDRYMVDIFSRMLRGTPFHYLPEACNPRMHRTVPLTAADRARYGCELMIAGNNYYYRQDMLQQLGEFELKVWGARQDWMVDRLGARHMGRAVFGDDKARAACAAAIALNNMHYAEIDGLNCRAFELAGCGAFQLASHVPVLAEHFVPDEEIVTFRTIDELIDKARHFLREPEARARIALRGQQRAHRDHTYERRLAEIFAKLQH